MRNRLLLAAMVACQLAGANVYREALPGYKYEFPRDHFNHPEFQTEWWYYTGNLHTADGRRFGFELTFFRQGVQRGDAKPDVWDVQDVWMAHLALSDIGGAKFHHTERLNRAGAGLAGADQVQQRIWNGNWESRWQGDAQQLKAVADGFAFDLTVKPEKPPVIHGSNGVSQKAEGEGRASHYISFTRLATKGTVTVDGKPFTVEGASWMDHEFFTHQLESNQVGWDWLSLQFDDRSEVMLFQLRHKDGSRDPFSAGTYVDPQGHARHLSAAEFSLTPGATWTSSDTGGHYPVAWTIRIPAVNIEASVHTPMSRQELTSHAPSPSYWEGAIDISGTHGGKVVKGSGYLEMTGYAGGSPVSFP